MKYSVLLHNIRSVYNVGSIFRTADAAGFSHVYITGYTPSPIDRFGRQRSDIHKVALGAEQSVSWSYTESIKELIQQLKDSGVHIIAVEQSSDSFDYRKLEKLEINNNEVALLMGEETQGIEPEILKLVDGVVEIPMRGEKESLNVSVSFGIVAYEITKAQE